MKVKQESQNFPHIVSTYSSNLEDILDKLRKNTKELETVKKMKEENNSLSSPETEPRLMFMFSAIVMFHSIYLFKRLVLVSLEINCTDVTNVIFVVLTCFCDFLFVYYTYIVCWFLRSQ